MAEISEKERAELLEKYGDEVCFVHRRKHGTFVFRKPSPILWKKFQSALDKKNATRQVCVDQLCIDCLCYPEAADGRPDYAKLTALLEDYPALAMDELFEDLAKLAMGREDISGKL